MIKKLTDEITDSRLEIHSVVTDLIVDRGVVIHDSTLAPVEDLYLVEGQKYPSEVIIPLIKSLV